MKTLTRLLPALPLLAALAPAHAQTTGSVGIGTTAPDASAALEIKSSSQGFLPPRLTYAQRTGIINAAAGLLVYQSDASASPAAPAGYYYYTGTQWLPLGQGDNLGNHQATQNLNLNTYQLVGNGGSQGLGVSSSGSVGIGTTAPAAPLDVQAGAPLTGANTGTSTQLRLTRPGTSGTKWNGAAELAVGTYATGVSSQSQLDFLLGNGYSNAADQTVLTLRGDGRVGVGTSAPTALLDVAGTTRLRGLSTAGLVTTDASGNLSSSTATAAFGTNFIQNTTTQQASSNFNISGIGTIGGNALVGGSLGIGTTAPAQELHVQGGPALTGTNTGTSSLVRLTRPGTSGAKWDANAELALGTYATGVTAQAQLDFNLGQNGNATPDQTVLTLRGDGRVGVGTTGPLAQLEVDLPTASAASSLKLEHRGSNLIVRPAVAGGGSTVVENTAGNLLLNPGGYNVGIGTTAPRAALDVNGSVLVKSYNRSFLSNGVSAGKEYYFTWHHNLGYLPILMSSIDGAGGSNSEYVICSYENIDNNNTKIRVNSTYPDLTTTSYFTLRWIVVGQQ